MKRLKNELSHVHYHADGSVGGAAVVASSSTATTSAVSLASSARPNDGPTGIPVGGRLPDVAHDGRK